MMTKEQVGQWNELIAQFLGVHAKRTFWGWKLHRKDGKPIQQLSVWTERQAWERFSVGCCFHNDWNYLMDAYATVKEKGQALIREAHRSRRGPIEEVYSLQESILRGVQEINKSKTYVRLVEFIKWYNKQ